MTTHLECSTCGLVGLRAVDHMGRCPSCSAAAADAAMRHVGDEFSAYRLHGAILVWADLLESGGASPEWVAKRMRAVLREVEL